MGHSTTVCSPPGTAWSNVGPPQGHKSYQETCSSVDSSLHRGMTAVSSWPILGRDRFVLEPPGIGSAGRGGSL
ncbi:hypothetical protein BTVI_45920 [Pitangus sulphuratus]|nr:hypothetical protein BTVI_45920 [Pitangus sulphuratus]